MATTAPAHKLSYIIVNVWCGICGHSCGNVSGLIYRCENGQCPRALEPFRLEWQANPVQMRSKIPGIKES